MAAQPSGGCRGNWKNFGTTPEEEAAYDYIKWRVNPKPTGFIGSVAHVVKGSLGGGLLGGHVAFMKGGAAVSPPCTILFGIYMTYCLYILVRSAQILYRRTRVSSMSYPDVGEAAMACFPNPSVAKFSKVFRYTIDTIICIDLFGACAAYQLIISKTIKQLVENTQRTSTAGVGDYPDLRVYLACMIIPMIIICMITHLKWLAPFSIGANLIVLFCVFLTIYYSMQKNPSFSDLVPVTTLYNFFEFVGMTVFSMSCVGVVIPIENNMKDPRLYPHVLVTGMTLNVVGILLVSFFGYVGYLDDCESPITVNFPMTIFPKILKGLIAVMIYITHALNFWVPFNLVFYYLKLRHKEEDALKWELIYRAIIVTCIALVAITFPNINALMGFLGTFCLSNMAFIWPNTIYLMTIWQRPGLGPFRWRLWFHLILICIGIMLFFCGSVVNIRELLSVFV